MTPEKPEFSRRVDVSELSEEGANLEVSANAEEAQALAERFGLLALDGLHATLEVIPLENGIIRVSGNFTATVSQNCVVTLEPVRQQAEDRFIVLYARPGYGDGQDAEEVEVDALADEPPEPVIDGRVDLGEAVAQQLALAIDPYPRAEGVSMASVTSALEDMASEPKTENGPFAALAKLKQKE